MITMQGLKMSKTGHSFAINDLEKIKPTFLKIVKQLKLQETENENSPTKIPYDEIIKRAA